MKGEMHAPLTHPVMFVPEIATMSTAVYRVSCAFSEQRMKRRKYLDVKLAEHRTFQVQIIVTLPMRHCLR
jgi:hypothetical protein